MVWVRGDDGAKDCLEHEHWGDKSFEQIDEGGGFREVADEEIFSVRGRERHQVRRVVGEDRSGMFVDAVSDSNLRSDEF